MNLSLEDDEPAASLLTLSLVEPLQAHPGAVAGAVLAAALGLLFLTRKRRQWRRQALQRRWDAAGKNVVVLHQFPRATHCINISPYPIKLETFLRLAGIEYVIDTEEIMGAKGKSPWITFNGVNMADSQLCIEHLSKELGIDIDGHLTTEERAQARAVRAVLEDHFYFLHAMDRWVHDEGRVGLTHFGKVPSVPAWVVRYQLKRMGRKLIGEQCRGQGLGRHTRDEIVRWGIEDLEVVSVLLGDKPFVMGDRPSLVDLSLFGFMCMLFFVSPEDNVFACEIRRRLRNLWEHTLRMKARFYPDWDQCLAESEVRRSGKWNNKDD